MYGISSLKYDIRLKVKDFSVFTFDHDGAGMLPCNMSRRVECKDLELATSEDGKDVCEDTVQG